jgi:hypothetical protein
LTQRPFSLIWSNVPAGVHVLRARATDDAGRTSESSMVIKVNGLEGLYFANVNLRGTPVRRSDVVVDFDWQTGIPVPGAGVGNIFSAKWTGEIQPRYSETYTFTTDTDDGCRLWVDGQRLIDAWQGQTYPNSFHSATIKLDASRRHVIQMNYANFYCCGAWAHLYWASPSQPREIIPAGQLFPPTPAANRPPNTPVPNNPAGDGYAVTSGVDLPIGVDFFSDPDAPAQTQIAADWEIYTTNPSNLVWYSYGTTGPNLLTIRLSGGVFTNSHAGLSGLLPNLDFVLRVRHQDSSGATNSWSNWGLRAFNTRPPGISVQPHLTTLNQTNPASASAGANVMISVGVTNIMPSATYQWQFNGQEIAGATLAVLALTNVQPSQTGNYTVRVANSAGSVLSAALMLLVDGGFAGATIIVGTSNNASSWLITGGGATAVPAFQTSANHPGEISLTGNAFRSGSFASGGSLPAFDGFWFADLTFTLPTNAAGTTLNFDSLYGNDRVVLQLNGTIIGNATYSGAMGPGVMRFPGGFLDVAFTFTGTTSGTIRSGFLPGINTLRLVVNNTGQESISAPTASFAGGADATDAFLNATVTYEIAELPVLRCVMQSGTPSLQIYGRTNSTYAIQSAQELPTTNWTTLTNIVLMSSPDSWLDLTATNLSMRFYRAIRLP